MIDSNPNNESEPTLKSIRKSLDLSQESLGKRINLSYRTIAEWESGRKVPRLDNAIALARELGISLKSLAKSLRIDVEGVPDDKPLTSDDERLKNNLLRPRTETKKPIAIPKDESLD